MLSAYQNDFVHRQDSNFEIGGPSLPISELRYPIDFIYYSGKVNPLLNIEITEKVSSLYKKGLSASEISKLLGFSKFKVLSILKKMKIELRLKTAHALPNRLLKHGKQATPPYYGFCYFEGHIIKDPREFPILQIIYDRLSKDKTIQEIVTELNSKKLPSRTGKLWSWGSVKKIAARIKEKKVILQTGGQYELR